MTKFLARTADRLLAAVESLFPLVPSPDTYVPEDEYFFTADRSLRLGSRLRAVLRGDRRSVSFWRKRRRLLRVPAPRVRVVIPYGAGYLLEEFHNPLYPENLGKVRFPGGGVEPGESLEEAAARELAEEVGSFRGKLRYLGVVRHPEFGHNEHVFALLDHTLKPGVYTGDGRSEPVHLFEAGADHPRYWGPDVTGLLKLIKWAQI